MNLFMNKDAKKVVDITIKHIIQQYVSYIRNEFANEYNIENGCFKNYRGLSYDMSLEFMKRINMYLLENNLYDGLEFESKLIEGYNKIHKNGYNKDITFSHYWIEIRILNIKVYVDLCSQEYRHIYKDIPDYYIGFKKPKWFFKNYQFKFINDFIGMIWRPLLNINN